MMFGLLCFIFLIVGLFTREYTLVIASGLYGIASALIEIAHKNKNKTDNNEKIKQIPMKK